MCIVPYVPFVSEPRDVDFDEDISEDERTFYKTKFNGEFCCVISINNF